MQRPKSHYLSEESSLKFQSALPGNWVKIEQKPDYGYDFDIQVYENQTPTPFHFYVQLKSTESAKITGKGVALPFETEYFKKILEKYRELLLIIISDKYD